MTEQQQRELVDVIQADRDEAWPFMRSAVDTLPTHSLLVAWNAGEYDNTDIVQAFARHRLAFFNLPRDVGEDAALAQAIRAKLERSGLSIRDAAPLVGVSFSTLARAARGGSLLASTRRKVRKWLGKRATLSTRPAAQEAVSGTVRYAALGETSTEGPRWYIWRSGHGPSYVGGNIASKASAESIAAELNRLSCTTQAIEAAAFERAARVTLIDAFEMGYGFAMSLRGQVLEDSRAVGRLLGRDIFGPIADRINAATKELGFDSFQDADSGVCQCKRIIHAALSPTTDSAMVMVPREQLGRIRTSMAMLQQNAEGCAVNHYGDDFALHGTPGWLVDTRTHLDDLTAMLAAASPTDAAREDHNGN